MLALQLSCYRMGIHVLHDAGLYHMQSSRTSHNEGVTVVQVTHTLQVMPQFSRYTAGLPVYTCHAIAELRPKTKERQVHHVRNSCESKAFQR